MSQTTSKQIAEKIRQLREDKSFTQEYMAAQMGLSQNGYSKIELNYTKLTVERLLRIADLLETEARELLPTVKVTPID
jgi:transcriptional regulator with XRE-family HTH domain